MQDNDDLAYIWKNLRRGNQDLSSELYSILVYLNDFFNQDAPKPTRLLFDQIDVDFK
jgi:hypothetical protein